MSRYTDLTGRRFGSLVVLRRAPNKIDKNALWQCLCDCGNQCSVTTPHLTRGIETDCGCKQRQSKSNNDLIGKQFGYLTVIQQSAGSSYLCRCTCGNEKEIEARDLLRNHNTSCGCMRGKHRRKDISGMRSGKVVVIEPSTQKRRNVLLWKCRCDCGKEFLTEGYKISSGIIQSCGCERTSHKLKDLTGQRFGKLVALCRLEEKRGSSYLWKCQCDCGNTAKASVNELLKGGTKTCGCGKTETALKTIAEYGTVIEHTHYIDDTCVELLKRKRLNSNNTSGFTGVQARRDRWIAVITFKKKVYYLGSYKNIEDAVAARKRAEEHYFDTFLDWYYKEYRKVGSNSKEMVQGEVETDGSGKNKTVKS